MNLVPVGYRDNITLYGGDGLQWVDAETISRGLYPNSKQPRQRINNVYNRNKAAFADRDTVLLKVDIKHDLQTHSEFAGLSNKVTQKREVRFFSIPYGVAKICNLSRSPQAVKLLDKLFDLHEAFIRGLLPKPQPALLALAGLPAWDRKRSEGLKAIAQAENVHENTVRRRLKRVENGDPVTKKKARYVHIKNRPIYNECLRLKKQGFNALKVAESLKIPFQNVYNWFNKPLT